LQPAPGSEQSIEQTLLVQPPLHIKGQEVLPGGTGSSPQIKPRDIRGKKDISVLSTPIEMGFASVAYTPKIKITMAMVDKISICFLSMTSTSIYYEH
jgi:hypothetical protein